jgi:hypothetical protein
MNTIKWTAATLEYSLRMKILIFVIIIVLSLLNKLSYEIYDLCVFRRFKDATYLSVLFAMFAIVETLFVSELIKMIAKIVNS